MFLDLDAFGRVALFDLIGDTLAGVVQVGCVQGVVHLCSGKWHRLQAFKFEGPMKTPE